eukprot:6197566-Pleurochrysis_carterae.AAC.5
MMLGFAGRQLVCVRSSVGAQVLGIERSAEPAEIRRAYHQQCLLWHPDKHAASEEAQRRRGRRCALHLNAAICRSQCHLLPRLARSTKTAPGEST